MLSLTPFTFGKYEGEYMEDIVNSDPSYVFWVITNTKRYVPHDVQAKAIEWHELMPETVLDRLLYPLPDREN